MQAGRYMAYASGMHGPREAREHEHTRYRYRSAVTGPNPAQHALRPLPTFVFTTAAAALQPGMLGQSGMRQPGMRAHMQ